jgi:hypothetical protein
MLAPYTLLTSNEFQPLRHHSHSKPMFAVYLPAKCFASRQSSCVFYSAVTWLNPMSVTLLNARHAVTLFFKSFFVVSNHNTANTLRPLSVPTCSNAKTNTRCYRFKYRVWDGFFLGRVFRKVFEDGSTYIFNANLPKLKASIREVSTVVPVLLW